MHLIDAFMPVIAHVVQLRSDLQRQQPEYEQVKGEILRQLELAQDACRKGGIDEDDHDQALFVVCAWIDEAILASGWNGKQQWQHDQLQRARYHTTEAGVEVFDRLERLQPHQRDVCELFYLCLALGFRGRYIRPGDEILLQQLRTSNLKLLENLQDIPPLEKMELFPGAIDGSRENANIPKANSLVITPFTAVVVAAPVILFAFLYIVYRFVLNGLALPVG
ncbi:MAG TPA: DotU family type IV/VI secretion system protein [Geobacter sp.]|nr:DotU family type IV/VI secretion system protein [Geobacter sp.]